MKIFQHKQFLFLSIILEVFGITAFMFMFWLTPYGSGVSADSIIYLDGANNLISGKGFSSNGNPITHYPPLYPIFLIAAKTILGWTLLQSTRVLMAFLYTINVVLTGLAAYLSTRRNFLATTFSMFFFCASSQFMEVHAWAWSEPLFFTFSLACILLLSLYVIDQPWLCMLDHPYFWDARY